MSSSESKFGQIKVQFTERLWRDPAGSPLPLRLSHRALQIAAAIVRDLRNGDLSMRAMSLVYTTVIAIVPLIAIVFSVLKGFGLHEQVEPALLDALSDLGDKRFEIVDSVMGFINNVNVGVLGSLGFAILLFSVISMMQKIERAFNATWKINRGRQLSERLRDYLSVIFAGPLLIFLSAALTTSFQTSIVYEYVTSIGAGEWLVYFFSKLLPYLLMTVGFALLYLILPNTKVRLPAALIGGLVTAIFWKAMGWGVSQFIANSAASVAIYSAFASVIILMVWMQLAWLVLLIGASVAFYVQNADQVQVSKTDAILSAETREKLAVSILCLVGRDFIKGEQTYSIDVMRLELAIDNAVLHEAIDELKTLGYLAQSEDGDLLLKRAPENIEIETLVNQLRRGDAYQERLAQLSLSPALSKALADPPSTAKKGTLGALLSSL